MVRLKYQFGNLTKNGYRHFPILYFAYGRNGFLINILGLSITIKLWK